MAANMSQMFTGLNYGGPRLPGTNPASPATSLQVQANASAGAGSGAPLGFLLLAAIGGLVILYYGTRTIQGIR